MVSLALIPTNREPLDVLLSEEDVLQMIFSTLIKHMFQGSFTVQLIVNCNNRIRIVKAVELEILENEEEREKQ